MQRQIYLDVATARDKSTFQARLVDFADRAGFPIIAGVLVLDPPGQQPVVVNIGNIPTGYEDSFSDTTAGRADPVLTRLRTLAHPIVYDQSLYVQDGAGHLWEHQAAWGFKTGIAMALHMRHDMHFLLGVDREEPLPADDDALLRMIADLQLLAAYAQDTAVRLLVPEMPAVDDLPPLTAREHEILKWTAAGKSASVIAQLLSLNIGTVNFHLQSAARKLRVAGKHQAVAAAIRLGIL